MKNLLSLNIVELWVNVCRGFLCFQGGDQVGFIHLYCFMWICMFIISLLHLFWYNQHTWFNIDVPCFEPLAEKKQYRNNTSSYLGPMRSPTKFISGYSSCGIITLSLTLVAGGLGKIKVVLIKIWLPSTTDTPPPRPQLSSPWASTWSHLGKGHNGESSAHRKSQLPASEVADQQTDSSPYL